MLKAERQRAEVAGGGLAACANMIRGNAIMEREAALSKFTNFESLVGFLAARAGWQGCKVCE
jgi:hypothetical protein